MYSRGPARQTMGAGPRGGLLRAERDPEPIVPWVLGLGPMDSQFEAQCLRTHEVDHGAACSSGPLERDPRSVAGNQPTDGPQAAWPLDLAAVGLKDAVGADLLDRGPQFVQHTFEVRVDVMPHTPQPSHQLGDVVHIRCRGHDLPPSRQRASIAILSLNCLIVEL